MQMTHTYMVIYHSSRFENVPKYLKTARTWITHYLSANVSTFRFDILHVLGGNIYGWLRRNRSSTFIRPTPTLTRFRQLF